MKFIPHRRGAVSSLRCLSARNPLFFIGLQLACLVFLALFIPFAEEYAWFALALALVLSVIGFISVQRLELAFSPLTVFLVSYFGYAVGAVYYSVSGEVGKFSTLTGTEVEFWAYAPAVSLLLVLCLFGFGLGYLLGEYRSGFSRQDRFYRESRADLSGSWLFLVYKPVVFISLSVGIFWWAYIAHTVSDGIVQFIKEFQLFPHRVSEYGISTLPYHFYYPGIFLWLYVFLLKGKTPGVLFWSFSLLGALINLTQGRVMLSATFLMALLVAVGLCRPDLRTRIVFFLVGVVFLAVVAYFLRIYSNYSYIGKEFNLFEQGVISSSVGSLVAGGNVPDLQQLVIILHTWGQSGFLYGLTYLDSFKNILSGVFGWDPSSVGLQIKSVYFPEESGPPTPGAVGEAYVNFGLFSPVFFVFVGFILAKIYRKVLFSDSVFLYIVYAIFATRFVFMYPKVDSTMMVSFFWGVFPFLSLLVLSYVLYFFLRDTSVRRSRFF
ncbi:hypothetical protein P8631_07685 [Guyparkeria sp. 1SP6A2]|nr:hypothetical protein [Guyparkeria sp. 1SP6A2]